MVSVPLEAKAGTRDLGRLPLLLAGRTARQWAEGRAACVCPRGGLMLETITAMRSICELADSSPGCRHDYQRATAELGTLLARYGCHLVYGGEAAGAMRTVFEAALEAGGSATGVLPRERAEHGELAETRLNDLRLTGGRHARTALMAELSDAMIAVPGGLETGAAFTEICTRTQLGQHHTPAALLNTSGYFNGLVNLLDQAVHDGFLHTDTRTTITVERDPVVLLERLVTAISAP